ncbi:uncharacterized protein LOC119902981 [Micropterus salmoides]|uniref:uncharacterized protein LOC119902981 n=1 Tax=Micropterus salmoides TaxID=27706 RepID=UPI0018EC1702|nr:uncharacterized protein LOC119902981 [Micropterus salmoides]
MAVVLTPQRSATDTEVYPHTSSSAEKLKRRRVTIHNVLLQLQWSKLAATVTYAQTTVPNISQTGCAGPPVLCCARQNNSCFRGGCFCDEVCVSVRDCCPDHSSTCTQHFTTALPTGSSTTINSTTSTPVDGSNTTASITTNFTTALPTGSSTTINSTTSTPVDGSNTTASTVSITTRPTRTETGVVHLHLSALTHKEESEDVLEGVSTFVSHVQALLQQSCGGCTLNITRIKLTRPSSV